MNITIKHLRAFASVADVQSFHLAAQRLNVTAGAISLLVRDLERMVGFALFDRTTRRVALSKAGRDFLPAAQLALRHVQAAEMAAHDVRNRATGVVRVAAPLIVAHAMLPAAMAAYRKCHPRVLVRPTDCTVENLVHFVEDDRADLAIGPDRPTGEQVGRISLYESPWVLWCSPGHPLAKRKTLTWSNLKGQSVVAAGRDYETCVAEATQRRSDADRFVPTYVVDNITTALGIASSGLGVTLSPMYVGLVALPMGLVMKHVEGPEIVRDFCIYRSRVRTETPAVSAFAEFLQAYLSEHRLRPAPERSRGPRAGTSSRMQFARSARA